MGNSSFQDLEVSGSQSPAAWWGLCQLSMRFTGQQYFSHLDAGLQLGLNNLPSMGHEATMPSFALLMCWWDSGLVSAASCEYTTPNQCLWQPKQCF